MDGQVRPLVAVPTRGYRETKGDMSAEYARDAAAIAAILGFFALSWFGWALEKPPTPWLRILITAVVLSVVTAIGGGLLVWQHWSGPTVFDPATGRAFGIIVGLEFGIAGIGAWLLASRQKAELIPVWVAFVVGVHFVPLAPLLRAPLLYPLAVVVVAAAAGAVPLARRRTLAVSAVTGAGTGSVLLLAAVVSLITVLV